jgi:formamidopyrimidine-DNA glycosylase
MAEAPEVEILAQGLREAVVGRTIQSAEVLQPAAVRFPSVDEFAALLANRQVLGAQRRAKYILMPLGGDVVLAMHMMLWGTLRLLPRAEPRAKDTLIVWQLDGDQDLRLTDPLGYARVALGPTDELTQRLDLTSLGPDALDPAFTPKVLANALAKRRGVLRVVLINQRVLAGLGIRDADESLWLAQIDPRRSVASLTPDEFTRLHSAIVTVLSEGLALRGTQRDLFGRKGQAVHGRYVFEQGGKPCPRCSAIVKSTRLNGRNAFFCPACQR